MKLSDLRALFIRHERRIETYEVAADPANYPKGGFKTVTSPKDFFVPVTFGRAHGIRFLCPKDFAKNGGERGTHEVMVFFQGSPVPPEIGLNKNGETVRWSASGTGLSNLTLTPSIEEEDDHCKWHGFVTNGDAA